MNADNTKQNLHNYVKDYYWGTFWRNTAILSGTCRQLALSLGGLVWFAKSDMQSSTSGKLILLFVVLFFMADVAQYLVQGYAFHQLAECYDKKIGFGTISDISQLVEKPKMKRVTHGLFITKLILLGFASLFFIAILF